MIGTCDDCCRQAFRIAFLFILGVLIVGLLVACGGGSGGGEQGGTSDGGGNIAPNDFDADNTQEGSYGDKGSYEATFFNNADTARQQYANDNIPNVVSHTGSYYILNIQQWPEGWAIGRVVLVKMPSGVIEYKRIAMRFELDDGRLAIAAYDANLLDAVSSMTVSTTKAPSPASVPSAMSVGYRQAASIVDYTNAGSHTFTVMEPTDFPLFDQDGVNISLSNTGITGSATYDVDILINNPLNPERLVGMGFNLIDTLDRVTQRVVDDTGIGAIVGNGDGAIVTGIAADALSALSLGIVSDTEVTQVMDDLNAIVNDPDRLSRIHIDYNGQIIIDTTLIGTASVGASVTIEKDLPFAYAVPLPIPVPVFLSFELKGVGSASFNAVFQATTGATVTLPININMHYENGQHQDLHPANTPPNVQWKPITLDGTEAGFNLALGLQVECGLTVPYVISASLDPTITTVFDAGMSTENNCINIDWDLYLRAYLEPQVKVFGKSFTGSQIDLGTIGQGVEPMGVYSMGDACECDDPIDTDCNDCIDDYELMAIAIPAWKRGEISISELLAYISLWKTCGSSTEKFIIGEWNESIDIGCDGVEDETNKLIFHDDHTFESNPRCNGYEGTWEFFPEEDRIRFTFNGCDYPEYEGGAGMGSSSFEGVYGAMVGKIEEDNVCWSAKRIIAEP